MADLWQELVDTIDAQISVDDSRFWWDLRGLFALPAIPLFIAMMFVRTPSILAGILLLVWVATEAVWVAFLFRRRAIKKKSWIEPTRFSDQSNGY